ncbi:unnamed protein product [Peronospora farinosa]|uniref:Uncharacterized protein n=1 Tax=Peronospora farinosa TaxID=134698 RepID=A0AAV0TDF6_9STRA|nr:unnamed protein product [Peronospora farinosa]
MAARSSLSQQQQQQKTPAIVPEIVWERQRLDYSSDVGVWVPAEFDLVNRIAAYTSCNCGDIGQNIADVVPARLLNKPHLWISDWEVDYSLPHCDEERWVYASSHVDFGKLEEPHVHREEAVKGGELSRTAKKTESAALMAVISAGSWNYWTAARFYTKRGYLLVMTVKEVAVPIYSSIERTGGGSSSIRGFYSPNLQTKGGHQHEHCAMMEITIPMSGTLTQSFALWRRKSGN